MNIHLFASTDHTKVRHESETQTPFDPGVVSVRFGRKTLLAKKIVARSLGRVLLLSAFSAVLSSTAYAQGPSHIRVLWDVQNGPTCMLVRPLADPDRFELPSAWPCAGELFTKLREQCADKWCRGEKSLLRKGDYVTVYAFNYNAVSYKPLAPVVTTLKPEDPVAISVLAAVLQAAGFPVRTAIAVDRTVPPLEPSTPCGRPLKNPPACLAEISVAIAAVQRQVETWEANLRPDAEAIATARPGIPARLRGSKPAYPTNFGIENLDITGCAFSVVERKRPDGSIERLNPAGGTCTAPTGWVQTVGAALGRAAALIRAFDSAYDPAVVTTEHVTQRDRHKRAFDGWIEYLVGNQSGVRSEVAAGVAQLADDLAAIKSYRAALDPAKAASYAVELPRQGPLGRLNTLVFALPLRFVGDPEGAPAQVSRTLSLEVPADYPFVIASAGVMWLPMGAFDFKKLAIEQVPSTAPPALSRSLRVIDSDEFRDVTPLLGTHFRVHPKLKGVYGVLGTTGDKKIFRTVILGGSYFVPRLRSLFTVGALGAKGSKEGDLAPLVDRYSLNGVVSDSINLTQLFPQEKWYWTLAVAWTLTPF